MEQEEEGEVGEHCSMTGLGLGRVIFGFFFSLFCYEYE